MQMKKELDKKVIAILHKDYGWKNLDKQTKVEDLTIHLLLDTVKATEEVLAQQREELVKAVAVECYDQGRNNWIELDNPTPEQYYNEVIKPKYLNK